MKKHSLAPRELPYDDSWDVIVVGGGPAGSAAATAAAREGVSSGCRVLLIEAGGCLGGMGTAGLVPAWCPFSDKEKLVYRGIAAEVFEASKAGMRHIARTDLDWVPIDPERLKRVYDDLVLGSGARVLFGTSLAAVETDGTGGVAAIIASNKAGLVAYSAKVYIDCTGDADLAAWAGAEWRKGDESGDMQPATHCFSLSNVDEYGYRFGPRLHGGNAASPIYRILAEGRYPGIPDSHLCNNLVGPGTVGFNAGHLWNVDNTDPASLSRALVEGRKMAAVMRDALAEYVPEAFSNAFLCATGSLMGIRETRRIVGDYELTISDYLARRSFPDEICRNNYFIDVHHAEREIELSRAGRIEGDQSKRLAYGPGESHGIPYRCLIPKGLRNVLVAGRSISTDRAVQGSVRVMPVCLAMGQGAGTAAAAAAISTDRIGDVRAIDIGAVRSSLRAAGVYLE